MNVFTSKEKFTLPLFSLKNHVLNKPRNQTAGGRGVNHRNDELRREIESDQLTTSTSILSERGYLY